MNERLKQFLEMESLTPTRFAEMMDIQRSGISHLLSGRNKPSFEFIQKMMTTFPSLNYEWLILGKGKPYKEQSIANNSYRESSRIAEDYSVSEPVTDETDTDEPDNTAEAAVNQDNTSKKTTPEPSENHVFINCPSSPKRTISRIMVFYSDGTFEER